jgi:hypothetical protein
VQQIEARLAFSFFQKCPLVHHLVLFAGLMLAVLSGFNNVFDYFQRKRLIAGAAWATFWLIWQKLVENPHPAMTRVVSADAGGRGSNLSHDQSHLIRHTCHNRVSVAS